jgi:hypothetical protein
MRKLSDYHPVSSNGTVWISKVTGHQYNAQEIGCKTGHSIEKVFASAQQKFNIGEASPQNSRQLHGERQYRRGSSRRRQHMLVGEGFCSANKSSASKISQQTSIIADTTRNKQSDEKPFGCREGHAEQFKTDHALKLFEYNLDKCERGEAEGPPSCRQKSANIKKQHITAGVQCSENYQSSSTPWRLSKDEEGNIHVTVI